MVNSIRCLLIAVSACLSLELSAQTAEASVTKPETAKSDLAKVEVDNGVVEIDKFSGPELAVWNTTQTLLSIIDEERASFGENPNKFYNRVATALEPVVGFRRIAAMVMGSYYKQATKEQRAKFSQLFERSLVETYSGGLIEYDGYTIDILPGEPVPEGKRTSVVNVVITTSSGTQVPLKYSMYKTKKGEWKVQNVTVAGINVGLLYRQQFARKVAEANGDIGTVVSQWSSKLDVEVEDGQVKTPEGILQSDNDSDASGAADE
jgi:phospholipid transport system substrate-binding protein